MAPLKVGLIGSGGISRAHMPAFLEHTDEVQLTAVCDIRQDAARAYVNHRRGAHVENGILTVSKIYAWYVEDFGDSAEGVIAHLKIYAQPDLAEVLERAEGIDGYAYDWSLNEPGGG